MARLPFWSWGDSDRAGRGACAAGRNGAASLWSNPGRGGRWWWGASRRWTGSVACGARCRVADTELVLFVSRLGVFRMAYCPPGEFSPLPPGEAARMAGEEPTDGH